MDYAINIVVIKIPAYVAFITTAIWVASTCNILSTYFILTQANIYYCLIFLHKYQRLQIKVKYL